MSESKYAILDESGKVRQWIDAGRGVRVWESEDIGAGRSDMLTPGDVQTPPHWAYPLHASRVYSAEQVTFFAPVQIVREWHDTPQGWRAARAALDNTPDETRDAPIGTVLTRYTLERFTLESDKRVPVWRDGAKTEETRPLVTRFMIGIMAWSAILPKADAAA